MAKAPMVPVPWTTLATILVKHYGIHEGVWRIYFAFETNGANLNWRGAWTPAAMVGITGFGLIRDKDDAPISELSVDAAVVNPKKSIVLVSTVQ